MKEDLKVKIDEARQKLPMRRVIEQRGHGPSNQNWKSFPCPFCGLDDKKRKAGLFPLDGHEMFKCFHSSCPTGTKPLDEIGFIAQADGLSRRDACKMYLQEAGVWKPQERHAPSIMPGFAPRKSKDITASYEQPAAAQDESKQAAGEPGDAPPPPEPGPEASQIDPGPPVESLLSAAEEDAAAEERAGLAPMGASQLPPENIVELRFDAGEGQPEDNDDTEPGQLALNQFFQRLTLLEKDEDEILIKRGLESDTSLALRFMSNPKTNRALLMQLAENFSTDDILASGLWLPPDRREKKPMRPNVQFCGYGQIKRKPKAERKNPDDKFVWGWCCPVLIPYFDANGRLLKLRPHKGGAPGDTLCGASRLYVPRQVAPATAMPDQPAAGMVSGVPMTRKEMEKFYLVVICEGEFKAAAIWQVLGKGRKDGRQPIGVCALPGISYVKNAELREELDAWLLSVHCRKVIVAFDDEEKADPALESFQPDKRKRYEAQVAARYLATDLSRKLHVRGEVCVLPKAWRNAKGKSDWDGALAKFVSEPELQGAI